MKFMEYQMSKDDNGIDFVGSDDLFADHVIEEPFVITPVIFQSIIKAAIRNGYCSYDALFAENIHCKWHNSSIADIFEEIQVMHDSGVELRRVYFRPIKKGDSECGFFVQNTGLVGICAPKVTEYEIKEMIRSASC